MNTPTTNQNPVPKARKLGLPAVAVAGSLGLLALARERFQRSRVFLPDRYPNGVWEPQVFGLPAEDVWFETPDGVVLHGWWIPKARARGTLLFCHGNTGSIAHRIGVLRHLRKLRVNIFAFDYRGYGRSGGVPSERGLYLDVRAAFDKVVEGFSQRPGKIVLFGHSLGGAVAVDCALDRAAAGLIVQSSFPSIREAARVMFPTLPLHLAARQQFRSELKVGGLSLPKLFVHGDADATVPLALGQRLYEAASDPKDLYVVRRAGHNDLHRHGGRRYLRRLSRFLGDSLAADRGRTDWASSLLSAIPKLRHS